MLLDSHVIVNINLGGGFVDISDVEVDKILTDAMENAKNITIVYRKLTPGMI